AARLQPPPHHCGSVDPELTWLEGAMHTLYPTSAERSCAEYLERTTRDTFPNPLQVLVDTLLLGPLHAVVEACAAAGDAWSRFLAHFSWLQQGAALTFVLVALIALVVLAPWLGACRRWGAAVHTEYTAHAPPPQSLQIEQLPDDYHCMRLKDN
ncbi:MAG: hypothetical protein Q7V62_13190, partial [Actinomycetota bacterium]|nr:hypothetical protein [Actinomycetota bacterium]